MKIAIFGGTFDPIHNGHLQVIKVVQQSLDIDRLFIVPVYINPFKDKSVASSTQRLKLINMATKNIPKIDVLDFEIKQHKPSYTINTIQYIYKHFDVTKIFTIIGADNLSSLGNWKDYKELSKMVEFVVIGRNNIKIENFMTIKLDMNISSSSIRNGEKLNFIPNEIKKDVFKIYNIG